MGITGNAYILGMADAIGELRRFALEKLREGDVDRATTYLDMMEEMFLVIMRFDFPDAARWWRRRGATLPWRFTRPDCRASWTSCPGSSDQSFRRMTSSISSFGTRPTI